MRFSALITVYKRENHEYFKRALKSIWNDQTLKPNEIVLVKDGPLVDNLETVIQEFQKQLGDGLKVIALPKNVGAGDASNEGLKYCSYDLVARMDSDDISLPQRFEKQVAFMEKHPDVTVCGAFIEEIDDEGKRIDVRKVPMKHNEIKKFAKSRSPVSHPVCIFRKNVVLNEGGYPILIHHDYALWSLLLVRGYKFANLPDILLKMRAGDDLLKRRGLDCLIDEIKVTFKQKTWGLIGWPTAVKNILIRSVLRLSPLFIKRILYKYVR